MYNCQYPLCLSSSLERCCVVHHCQQNQNKNSKSSNAIISIGDTALWQHSSFTFEVVDLDLIILSTFIITVDHLLFFFLYLFSASLTQ